MTRNILVGGCPTFGPGPIPYPYEPVDWDKLLGKPSKLVDPGKEKAEVIRLMEETNKVDHPSHYGGKDNPYEAIKVIEAWNLGFNLGNTIKYIARAGIKSEDTLLTDLKKAAWYLNREIENLSAAK